MIVLDRTLDVFAPLLHEFTYQAMANDLLHIENGRTYTYSYVGPDGGPATKETVLDEADAVWVDVRHKHMRDCIDKLMKDFNDFLGEHSEFANQLSIIIL